MSRCFIRNTGEGVTGKGEGKISGVREAKGQRGVWLPLSGREDMTEKPAIDFVNSVRSDGE
jgi:hypothetical protein